MGTFAEALFEGHEAYATVAASESVVCLPGCDEWGSPCVVSSKDPKKQAAAGESATATALWRHAKC